MDKNELEKLLSDPTREATDSFRGVAYQILTSVSAWINLKDDEILYLEGAEDFDKYISNKVEVTQVRNTIETLTLSSNNVQKALKNFWELQKNNPQKQIFYHYLTSSSRGKERGFDFHGYKGLDYWDFCKRKETDLQPIIDFLILLDTLPESLRNFLRTSTDSEEIRKELINKIYWDTENPSFDHIEDLVNKKLVNYGLRFRVDPSESKKVLPTLFLHIFKTIFSSDERSLDCTDFAILFEKKTKKPYSNWEIHKLQLEALPNYLKTALQREQEFKIQETSFISRQPILPEKVVPRIDLTQTILEKVKRNGIILIKGSMGTGKSTLAKMIMNLEKNNWRRFDFRGLDPNLVRAMLFEIAVSIFDKEIERNIILDDLNLGQNSIVFQNALLSLVFSTQQVSGNLIITSNHDLPEKIKSHFALMDEVEFNVPPLNLEEIKKLALEYDCPSGKNLETWANVILIKTSGNPQLAHASIKNLANKNWIELSDNILIDKSDTEDVLRDARLRLLNESPTEETKNLAYNLSIFGMAFFKRDHAILLGEKENLAHPGESFDLLVGPWIERVNEKYFRISPLLNNSAGEIWSSSKVKDLHSTVSSVLCQFQPISLVEINGILMHGIWGENSDSLRKITFNLLNFDSELWPRIAKELIWVLWIKPEKGKRFFDKDSQVSLMCRNLQFKIVSELQKVSEDQNLLNTEKIIQAWEWEIDNEKDQIQKTNWRVVFLSQILLSFHIPLKFDLLTSYVEELFKIIQNSKEESDVAFDRKILDVIPLILPRIKSIDDIDKFISYLENAHTDIREKILNFFDQENYAAEYFLLNSYSGKFNPDNLDLVKTVFDKVAIFGQRHNCKPLTSAVYRENALIHMQCNKFDDAFKIIEKGKTTLGDKNSFLEDALAIVHFEQQKFEMALNIWSKILPDWEKNPIPLLLYSTRNAEICASKCGDWKKAGHFASLGIEMAQSLKDILQEIGFMADKGFAQWKSGNLSDSISTFEGVLNSFSKLPDTHQNLNSLGLQKRIGHAISWMLMDIEQNFVEGHDEPPPGCFSNPEVAEEFKNLPLYPSVYLWMLLANIEYKINSGEKIFEILENQRKNYSLPILETSYLKLKIQHDIRNLWFDTLVQDSYELYLLLEKAKALKNSGIDILQEVDPEELLIHDKSEGNELIIIILFEALIVLVSQDLDLEAPILFWKENIRKLNLNYERLNLWLGNVDQFRSSPNWGNFSTTQDETTDSFVKLLTALSLSTQSELDPAERIFVNFSLFDYLLSQAWTEEVKIGLERIISQSWINVIENQKFLLNSLNVNIPLIQDAINNPDQGLKKIANILLCAKNAVDIYLPDSVLVKLRNKAN